MAHTILFLPGIMGSRLSLGEEEVWPPTALETIRGYKRMDKLQSPQVRPTGILKTVACFKFYKTILDNFDELGYTANGTDKRLLALAYDWRRDLFETADHIANLLDSQLAGIGDDDRLSIVAHSMGGLICRLMLECGTYDDRAWFSKIDKFITLATPHLGAPLALARTLGLDGDVGISPADFKEMAENAAYPSGYQLLPAPGEDACWDITPGKEIKPLDIYDPATAQTLGLVPALIDRARAVHDAFANGAAPDHIRYFYFAGSGHKTVSRVNVTNPGNGATMTKVQTRSAGDGTVPMWSALPRPTQKHTMINEHATVFRGDSFKNVFFAIFGQHIGSLELERVGGGIPTVSISRQVYRLADSDDGIEVVIDSTDGISELNGQIVVEKVNAEMVADGSYSETVPLAYNGAALRTLVLDLAMPSAAGFYRLRLELLDEDGEADDLIEPLPFSVTQ